MAFKKGNKFWEARSTHGRNPKFKTKDDLWDAAVEYFNWVTENPLMESKLVSFQGASVVEELPLMRAMTIEGLCNFLDMSEDTFANYGKKDDFLGVVTKIRSIIRQQKFEGASAGLLNSNIIARDLGLKDNQDLTSGGQKIDTSWTVEFVNASPKDKS